MVNGERERAMSEQKEVKPKLYIQVTPEFYVTFKGIAKTYGLTLNQLGNMAVQAGVKSIIRALSPEDAYSPEQLAAIIQVLVEKSTEIGEIDKKVRG